jgi:hypothetical protein
LSAVLIGATTTIINQAPITVPVTLTSTFPTQTLFSTCPSSQPTQPTQPPSSSDANVPGSETQSSSATQSIFTSASQSTLPNGQVSITYITYTSSSPPQTVTVPSSPGLNNSGGNSSTNSSNIGPIIGGVLGGFFGLLLIAGAFMW